MRLKSKIHLIGPLSLLCCFWFSAAYSQEKPRVYKHDFEGQDLTGIDLSKRNLDDANFSDAILKNTNLEDASLKNCNFQGAKFDYTNLRNADLTGSDFRKATIYFPLLSRAIFNGTDLSGVDLKGVNTSEMKFREANLRGTKGFNQIYGTDYYKADLRGADLSTAQLLNRVNFGKAKVDQFTRWPKGFDVSEHSFVFVETKPDEQPTDKTKPTSEDAGQSEARFQKLDKNEDGVLSGAEMKGLNARDANGDGEISLSEYLGKNKN